MDTTIILIVICSIIALVLLIILGLLLVSRSKGRSGVFSGVLFRSSATTSEEEIKDMVTDNEELLDDEKRMIHEIIKLGDTTVREVMQPRVDMIFVEEQETVKQTLDRMRGTGYSRLPVYREDYDRIIGVVYYKDLIEPLMEGKEGEIVGGYAFETLFVPETKEIYPLLSEMQANSIQMAIVVDEYGGTDGLITLEDIVEEIVGEITDETDMKNQLITQLTDDEWLVDGRLTCAEAAEQGWPVEESDEFETIAGWFMSTIDHVPQINDGFDKDGYSFKVQSMRRRRISIIRIKRLLENSSQNDGDDK